MRRTEHAIYIFCCFLTLLFILIGEQNLFRSVRVELLLCLTKLHYSARRRRRRYVPPTGHPGSPARVRTLTPVVHYT